MKTLNAREWLELYGSPIDIRIRGFALFIADHLPEARLANGSRLCDAGDFAAWLHEIVSVDTSTTKNLGDYCPSCGHVHQLGQKECGEKLGSDRICRCESRVLA